MNPDFDPQRYQRLRDAAVSRALELRRRAIDQAWDLIAAACRRVVARTPPVKSAPA